MENVSLFVLIDVGVLWDVSVENNTSLYLTTVEQLWELLYMKFFIPWDSITSNRELIVISASKSSGRISNQELNPTLTSMNSKVSDTFSNLSVGNLYVQIEFRKLKTEII